MRAYPKPPRIHLPNAWQGYVKPVQMFPLTIREKHLPLAYSMHQIGAVATHPRTIYNRMFATFIHQIKDNNSYKSACY